MECLVSPVIQKSDGGLSGAKKASVRSQQDHDRRASKEEQTTRCDKD
jgi:hypothetical protein